MAEAAAIPATLRAELERYFSGFSSRHELESAIALTFAAQQPVATVDGDGFLVMLREEYIPTGAPLYLAPLPSTEIEKQAARYRHLLSGVTPEWGYRILLRIDGQPDALLDASIQKAKAAAEAKR